MTRVRLAGSGDAASAARLLFDFNTEFEAATPPVEELTERTRRLLDAREITILLAGEGPEGLALLSFRRTIWAEPPAALLEELYVVPGWRGQGIGRTLLEAVLALCRKREAPWIELNTGEADVAARALYESLGFSRRDVDGESLLYYYELEL